MKCTFLLIHGLWLTPLSWEYIEGYLLDRGHQVVNTGWPGIDDRQVNDIRENSNDLVNLKLGDLISHYESIISSMPTMPVLVGHSMGGLVVQKLLERGLGVAGVVLDSAAPAQVMSFPLSSMKAMSPVLRNPANFRRVISLTWEQFRYAFVNTLPEVDARAAYDRYAVPAPGSLVFQSALGHFVPRSETRIANVNVALRPPLLFIAGGSDNTIPPKMSKANYRKSVNPGALTTYKEFPGRSHFLLAQDGWDEVAEFIESWSMPLCPGGA